MESNLKSISYQAKRLTSLRGSNRTEHITEKSMDLLTAIVKYYTACLIVFNHGLIGISKRFSRLKIVNAAKEIFQGPNVAYKSAASDLKTALYARSAGKITRRARGANKHRITGILCGDGFRSVDHQISESTLISCSSFAHWHPNLWIHLWGELFELVSLKLF
jgi:hypothetical protein